MAKRKLTALHEGVTFTRTTARTYTHVVIGRYDIEARVKSARQHASEYLRRNWDYYAQLADGTYRYLAQTNPEQIARAEALVAMGVDAAAQHEADRAEANARKNITGEWEALGWCGRPDLAIKEANRYRAGADLGFAEVVVIPVQA